MSQIVGAETFVDSVSPGDQVNAARLNNMTNGATLLNGAVLDQVEKTVALEADMLLLGDSTLAASGIPKKVSLLNVLPENVRNGAKQYAAGTLSTATYSVTLAPASTAYADGQIVRFKASAACPASPLLNVNAIGAFAIVTGAKTALAANDILNGQIVQVEWVAADNQWQMLGSTNVTPNMLTGVANCGSLQYAVAGGTSSAITLTLTNMPAAYTAGQVVRFKAASTNTLATGHTTFNLNAIGALNILTGQGLDLVAGQIQSGQIVELVYESSAGAWQLITSRTRYFGALVALPGAGTAMAAITHGLGGQPGEVTAYIENISTELGYAVGDRLPIDSAMSDNAYYKAFSPWVTATQIKCVQAAGSLYLLHASTGTVTAINQAKWNLRFVVEI